MFDQIKIKNLEVYAYHGVFPEETKLGQKFLVDAALYADTRKAGFTDNLRLSVDYGTVCHFITEYMKEHTFKLLEAVAEHLAEAILQEIPGVERIDLEIKKPWAPIALPIETASVAIRREWHTAYLSVGSNMGDRVAQIQQGLQRLSENPQLRDVKVSSFLETEPYGYTEQGKFVNAAIVLKTLYTPYELLRFLQKIEEKAGRKREIHWGPRTLDLDILFYDNEILEQSDLIVPHPDMENRLFVLDPLAELCPGKIHPVLGKSILRMRDELRKRTEASKL
ncbi:MAG: 2-amino-4-hydroxy-6-hydroxymethyldihydropteridine diphosphokinase [Clostridiales bacterium]|nr:2-amino-4-hydroxy-6-hydroxymethyldihydropteridine diphosphokinase [Clostridiales bacterium]